MLTKDDLVRNTNALSETITKIGNTIQEQKRQKTINKVLSQFQNPDKIFLNADGTPKNDAEIFPTIQTGVIQLMQLGENNLAGSLMDYYKNMSGSFNKESQNAFEYDLSRDTKYFPKDEAGKPVEYNSRTDYSSVPKEKQFAPQQPKSRYTFQRVDLPGPDGSGVVKYYKLDKVTGDVIPIDESEYTKEIKVSQYSGYNVNVSQGNEFKDQYIDNNGKERTVVFKDGVPVDAGTQQPIKDMTGWKSVSDAKMNQEQEYTGENIFKSPQYNQFEGALKQAYSAGEITLNQYNEAMDYVTGKTTKYPGVLYNLGFEGYLNTLREQYLKK